MRYILAFIALGLVFTACKKDKFTTNPQISFKSLTPDFFSTSTAQADRPKLTLHVTDSEGDLGFIQGKDTSFVYILNLRNNNFDSVMLADIGTAAQKNFSADIEINMSKYLSVPANTAKRDTIYYSVYIKDFAKNKSNVITTNPVYYLP